MKFNMGCGHGKLAGYVNVDAYEACEPDEVYDLEKTPWPWPDNCAEEVQFIHSLEHMGADPKAFLAIMRELYRIMRPGGLLRIHAPHPRHDNFMGDPTHVRIVTPQVLSLFDRDLNDKWKATGASNTPLAHYLDVDFVIENVNTVLDEPYASAFREGRMSQDQIVEAIGARNNVVSELKMTLRARKLAA